MRGPQGPAWLLAPYILLVVCVAFRTATAQRAPNGTAAPAMAPASANQRAWRARTVYQLLTDRFATDQCYGKESGDLPTYMGGTFAGMRKKLDYIQDLGFDAVWLSPVITQGPDAFGTAGYHGYWPSDLYGVNPAFGTLQELQDLVKAYQAGGVFVLFDQVINHMGYGEYASFNPFNKTSDFHNCDGCFETLNCLIDPAGPFASPASLTSWQHCKLSGLPDLNHSDPTVLQRMVAWQNWTVETFKPDGLRYDAVTNSLPEFVGNLTAAAGDLWTIGELFLEDPLDTSARYIANTIKQHRVYSAFAFPMEKALRVSIRDRTRDMVWFSRQRAQHLALLGPKVHDMGNFLENHDMPRWLAEGHTDHSLYRNGYAYVLFMEGIPFVYYGAEHGFINVRPPLWDTNFLTNTGLWLFLRVSNYYRQQAKIWDTGLASQVHVDAHTLVLQRGPFVVVLTNVGQHPGRPGNASMLSLTGLAPRFAGKALSNIYDPKDKLQVSKRGVGVFSLAADGRPQVFYDGEVVDPMSLYFHVPDMEARSSVVFAVFIALTLPTVLLTLLAAHCWAMQQRPRGTSSSIKTRAWTPRSLAARMCLCCGLGAAAGGSKGDKGPNMRGKASAESLHSEPSSGKGGAAAGSVDGSAASIKDLQAIQEKQQPYASLAAFFGRGRGGGAGGSGTAARGAPHVPAKRWASEIPAAGTSRGTTLHEASLRQSLAAASTPWLVSGGVGSGTGLHQRRPAARQASEAASSCTSQRIEAFSGSSAIFPDPGAVSAVDLAQGLTFGPSQANSFLQGGRGGPCGAADRDSVISVRSRDSAVSASSGGSKWWADAADNVRRMRGASVAAGSRMSSAASFVTPQLAGAMPSATIRHSSTTSASMPYGNGIVRVNSSSSVGPPAPAAAGAGAAGVEAAAAALARAASKGPALETVTASITASGELSSAPASRAGSQAQSHRSSSAGLPELDPFATDIMHVALEYALPHVGLTNQLMYGGLGMVVASFLREWPGPLSLVAPLYKACYAEEEADAAAADTSGASAASCDGILRPFFVPDSQKPLLEMTVDVAGSQVAVEVFKVEVVEPGCGQARTYYLVQSELFRHRARGQIYQFEDEDEMLAWLAVFNQATAAVVVAEGITHMQLHDYHGGMSLLYIPERLRPAVLYIAHNAHYDATFPIPTPARRQKVYSYLGLNAEQAAPFAEHNGSLDMLAIVVSYLARNQQGHGVVAVSPRYAQQIREKLPVFWALSPVGRPRQITGILNCMDAKDSLAASGMPLEQVLAAKAEAKLKLQEAYCLAVGGQYTLAVFVGRITHQKGCDIIAEAAARMMATNPTLQLVVVGPIGDIVGAGAVAKLAELSKHYPDRMYCPQDYYVAGDEKHMLLCACDFCLIPSRFEPCGLVDLEFGWNGALIVGHDTGGLGKMPGVYFTAQASHLAHLARKLEAAMDDAMKLSNKDKQAMIGDALARRFPAADMIDGYARVWKKIDRSYLQTQQTRRHHLQYLHDHASFFANKWAELNKGTAPTAVKGPTTGAAGGTIDGATTEATAHADMASHTVGPLGGPVALAGAAGACCAGRGGGCGGWGRPGSAFGPSFPAAQALSDYLLVVLQYWGLGPGVLLCTLLLLQEIRVSSGQCGLLGTAPQSLVLAHHLFNGRGHPLVPQLVLFFIASTVCAPLWSFLAAHLRPRTYIRLAATAIVACYGLLLGSMFRPNMPDIAVIVPVGVCNLIGNMALSLGFMGNDTIEVSEVGRRMLAVSETTKYVVLCVGMALAASASTFIPHMALAGIGLLLSLAMAAWFWLPVALSPAYQHLALTYSGQWKLLNHLSCFWLTLMASTCDALGFILTGFLVIVTSGNLGTFAAFQAVAFGCAAVAVLWNWHFLCSRTAELRLNRSMLGLAAMPAYPLLKAIVLLGFSTSSLVPGNPNTAAMLGVCAVLDLAMGGRSSIIGLAGFMTLPSREVVSIWQLAAITIGSLSVLLTMGIAGALRLHGGSTSALTLFGVILALEFIRACCMAVMARTYPRENLSAP